MNLPEILTALKAALVNSTSLSSVADANIFLGKRSNITEYPTIVIIPGQNRKVRDVFPKENWTAKVMIVGAIKVFDESKYIVGDSNILGIADLDNNIRKALSEDHTLGGKCINLSIMDTDLSYDGDYPEVGTVIGIEILYEQNRTTR